MIVEEKADHHDADAAGNPRGLDAEEAAVELREAQISRGTVERGFDERKIFHVVGEDRGLAAPRIDRAVAGGDDQQIGLGGLGRGGRQLAARFFIGSRNRQRRIGGGRSESIRSGLFAAILGASCASRISIASAARW